VFPEAICVQERRLRPLKKGLSRIIFQTGESFDFKKDVLVIPVGLNYSDAKKFRSKLFIDYGEPVSIKEFEERYKQDKVKTINEFTKYFEAKLANQLVNIKNKDNYALLAAIEEIYLQKWMKDKNDDVNNLEHQYKASRGIDNMINVLDEENPKLIFSLREKTSSYIKQLNAAKLRDHLLRPEIISKMNVWTFVVEYIKVYLGMPIYLLGLVLNYPPYYLSRKGADKMAKHAEFYASIYCNLTMFLWTFYYAIQLLIVALVFRNWLLLWVYAVIVPFLGWFVIRFYPVKKKIFGRWRLLRLVRKDRKTVEQLVNQRGDIIQEIEEAKKEYIEFIKS
jgi:glycerol-3-phosphate O-acyltransferase/dihydroxyacetone phosphate acyltransferase